MRSSTRPAPVSVFVIALLALMAGHGCRGCAGCADTDAVVIYTSVDQVFSEPIFQYCEASTGLKVKAVFDTEETKSTGVLNRLIAEAGQPQADVFWSNDPVRPFVLIDRGQVEAYASAAAVDLPEVFRAKDGAWTGFAARARVLLVNTAQVGDAGMPRSIRDLADSRWRGQTAIANPLFGTTTMHVAALFASWGDEEARHFLASLRENEVRIASSNGEVKRLVIAGEVAFGLTDTDDAYQALRSGAPVSVVYPDQDGIGTLFMPTSVVLIRDSPHPQAGRRLIDCLLEAEVERRMAKAAAHMPLRKGVETPVGIRRAEDVRAMKIDYRTVAETMGRIEPWLREWVGF